MGFWKINIYKPLARLTKKKTQIAKIQNKRGHYNQPYKNKKEATQMASQHLGSSTSLVTR